MTIIDAQVHIWGEDTPDRPWPAYGKAYAHRGGEPFGKDELLREMDAAGVDRVVIVPPSWEGERNDLALEAARLHPDRFAIMARPIGSGQQRNGTKFRSWCRYQDRSRRLPRLPPATQAYDW